MINNLLIITDNEENVADHIASAVWDMNYLLPLEHGDHGFEFHSRNWCLIDVYVCLLCVCVLCVGSGLATGWSPIQRVLPTAYKIKEVKNRPESDKWPQSHNNNNNNNNRLCGLVVTWLQFQMSGFDPRRYQIFWKVVCLERSPLSLVSTIEELFKRKSSGSGLEIKNTAVGIRHADHVTSTIRKSLH
jgi:hypothetical protein